MVRKTPAFTIVDLIVSMIITSVIVALAYYLLFLVNKGLVSFQHRSQAIENFFFFEHSLAVDCKEAQYIIDEDDDQFQMLFPANASIRYAVVNSMFVKMRGAHVDTLPVQVANVVRHYCDQSLKLIDRLELTVHVDGEFVCCTYEKCYSVKDLLQIRSGK